MPLFFPTAKCFAHYLDKIQDVVKTEGRRGEQNVLGLALQRGYQMQH